MGPGVRAVARGVRGDPGQLDVLHEAGVAAQHLADVDLGGGVTTRFLPQFLAASAEFGGQDD